MKLSFKVAILIAALGLSACTSPDRFGDGGTDPNANGGINSAALDPASPQYFSQTVGDRVLFPINQSSITSEGMLVLDGQAQWLLTNSDFLAIIEGHADEQGTSQYNLALGARRANSAREYLISRGVPASRLRTVSFGKERPAELCSNESCYSQNRRAVTVISAGVGTS